MTESTREKLIAELGEEMDRERAKIEHADARALSVILDRALTLRAVLQDVLASIRGNVPQSAYELRCTLPSQDVRKECERGTSEIISAS